jgi:predicted nucleic acid-binding protein
MAAMILGDLTIWSAALRGQHPALLAMFADLRRRGELTAPGILFGHLLAEAGDDAEAEKVRQWAVDAPRLEEPLHAWLAAGDLVSLLQGKGVPLGFLDAYLIGLAIREDAKVWTYNPRYLEVARIVPFQTYEPVGLRR